MVKRKSVMDHFSIFGDFTFLQKALERHHCVCTSVASALNLDTPDFFAGNFRTLWVGEETSCPKLANDLYAFFANVPLASAIWH
jgi:hypothetical protein